MDRYLRFVTHLVGTRPLIYVLSFTVFHCFWDVLFFLYFNISELNIFHCNHGKSSGSLGCMNLAVTVHIFITSLKLYILWVLHLLSLIAILKCLQKYYSIIRHWSENLSLMLHHGNRAPLARQMFDIGRMTSISYIFKSSSKSWDLHYL